MGDDREEIARIIDHEGYWERLDSCNHALATVSMTDDQRRALTAVRDDELRGTASSLAKADAILARQGPGPGEAVEACVVDIKAGLCCPRIHGCEQNDDDQYCLVRQAFIRAGLLPDPDAALLQGRLE